MNEDDDPENGEKLQVDRKRLEAMITGQPVYGTDIVLPNAVDFFDKVESLSGATILWPNQLKIGAKTKKDPFVKILGSPEQVESARQLISATLQRRRDRVTLKILLPHESHSHIIGRGGRGSKRIMQETACHIHFPDSNRYNSLDPLEEATKSDQVSITGSPQQVERAREILRAECLIVVSFEIPWFSPAPPPMPTLLPSVTAAVIPISSMWLVSLRAPEKDVLAMQESVEIVVAALEYHVGQRWNPDLRYDMRLPWMKGPRTDIISRTHELSRFENVRAEFAHDCRSLFLLGTLRGIMRIRAFITSHTPVALSFDCRTDGVPTDEAAIEAAFDVEMTTKKKNGAQNVDHTVVILRTVEDYTESLYLARERVLGLEETKRREDAPTYSNNYFSPEDQLLKSIAEASSDAMALPKTSANLLVSSGNGFGASCNDAFRSPDPDDSPIAHSLLKSAKELNKNSELWKEDRIESVPEEEKQLTRQEMMLKANRAVLDASFHHVRYPTDLWSGYGFSASLPAELIKAALDQQELNRVADENVEDEEELFRNSFKDSDEYAKHAARKMFSPSSGGLASVLEDEELDSNAYNCSTLDFSRKQRIPSIKKKQPPPLSFAASTSLFEASPHSMSSDLPWDIDVFVDPAMVLAQIGCSEYLPQFRAQEMDMRALLLSDEQSLKEIGVTTVGARKKIAHAILKLRESARAKGYDI
ncbi:bcc-1 [Pristionchus pacificus]|uniref:Bcc-1 n=1 Tax=Pristionchus pacificus TaxID=54126 RepID=A0A2A6C2H1_PRIPA|nr:bcc-1 [Pristionchus pacificus]|eukprot:PDM72336.1 bcc-1 [Pristionchus pacificus]